MMCASGWVQMPCRQKLPKPEAPDFYLFRVETSRVGVIDFRSERWCSPDVQLISISEGKVQGCVEQEALVLMPKYSWIRSSLGAYYAEPERQFWSANLTLSEREMQ